MTARLGIYRNTNEQFTFTATGALQPGEVVEIAELNKVGIVLGEAVIAIGDEVTVRFNAEVELLKEDIADEYAVGDEVMLKTKLADPTGTVLAGLCSKASGATDAYVRLMLNFALPVEDSE